MLKKLLTDTEACIHLGITKELLYAYVRNSPKKALNHNRKLVSIEVDGKNRFRIEDLDSFDSYLKEPWSCEGDKRPEIPSYIQEYLKTEIGGKCPITEKGYPLENAHIEDYNISKNHHHHNIIRIAKDEHTKFDNGVLSKSSLIQTKKRLVESLKKRMANSPTETKIITYLPSIHIENIKGRQDEIEKIRECIAERGRVTIVNGLGGIGKTSLAQLYSKLYYHEYDYFFWIEFPDVPDNSTSREVFMSGIATNFLILDFLGIEIDNSIPLINQFELVFKRITQLPGRKLFVLDNVPNAICEFSFMVPETSDFNILGTSRILMEDFINLTIDVLKESDAIDLFYSFYKSEVNDDLVLEILRSIGFHTLTIELISKLAVKRDLRLEEVLQIISSEGVNMSFEVKVTTKHDKNRKPTVPFNYLCDIFDLSQLSTKQTSLLQYLSIIGNIHLSFIQLENLLNKEFDSNELFDNLSELHHLGWITKISDKYYIHQLICEVLRFKLKPTFEKCTTLIDNTYSYIEKSSNDFSIHFQKKYIEIAEQILNTVELPKDTYLHYKLCITRHYGFSGNYEKYNTLNCDFEIEKLDSDIKKKWLTNHGNILLKLGKCKDAIEVLEECKNLFQDMRTLAQIDGSIAYAYGELGNFVKAIELFEPAYEILKNDPKLSKSELAVFTNNYSLILNGIGQYDKALVFSLEALSIREGFLDENHPLLAQSYNNVGVDYEYLKKFDEAILFHNKALKIRESFRDENNADLSESYHNLASVYSQIKEFSKAKNYFEKAIAIREYIYPEGSPTLIMTYCCLAGLMINFDSLQSIQLYRKSFYYFEKFDFENNQYTPFWAMGFSIALFENNEYKEALNYINLAIKMFEKINNIASVNQAIVIKNKILKSFIGLDKKRQGRNDSCLCGSLKKYKKCCGKWYQV
ncbi:tetratricopeptide repeat protein [Flavobacterium sp.]|uniref:tetratricopeptide repeat protein n=1 Tax=Flavobacterium sp. TaxID=239 RepID=UPI0026209369|nr:tetratricopeptide repeat protein [Flavobacterium sp.]